MPGDEVSFVDFLLALRYIRTIHATHAWWSVTPSEPARPLDYCTARKRLQFRRK